MLLALLVHYGPYAIPTRTHRMVHGTSGHSTIGTLSTAVTCGDDAT